jgi:hypothetical protein
VHYMMLKYIEMGWWFGTFFIPYIGNNHPNWLSYLFRGIKPPTRYIEWWFVESLLDASGFVPLHVPSRIYLRTLRVCLHTGQVADLEDTLAHAKLEVFLC